MLIPIIIFFSFVYYLYYFYCQRGSKLPPGPRPLPLLGNLNDIDPHHPGHSINQIAEKYNGNLRYKLINV